MGALLFLDTVCVGHISNGIVGRAVESSKLLNKMHATAWVCSQPGLDFRLAQAVISIVAEELEYVRVPGLSQEDTNHTDHILDLTLMRPFLRTKHGWDDAHQPTANKLQSLR